MKKENNSAEKKVIIVTGCSSGLGLSIARNLYFREGYRVVATSRPQSFHVLTKYFNDSDRFKIRALDVNDENGIYALVHEIALLWGRVDVVINNAAICYRAVIEHMDYESEMIQLKTNYLGPMGVIRSVLPVMREQRGGQIINISSVSGMLAMPTMGSYSASKHALEGATEALWYEAKPMGIKVNLVELGFINSKSFNKVILTKKAKLSQLLSGPHSEYYASMTPMIEKLMKLSFSSPEKICRKIIKMIDKPSDRLRWHLTLDAKLFSILKRMVPSILFNRFLYLMLPGSIKWGGSWKVNRENESNKKNAI